MFSSRLLTPEHRFALGVCLRGSGSVVIVKHLELFSLRVLRLALRMYAVVMLPPCKVVTLSEAAVSHFSGEIGEVSS